MDKDCVIIIDDTPPKSSVEKIYGIVTYQEAPVNSVSKEINESLNSKKNVECIILDDDVDETNNTTKKPVNNNKELLTPLFAIDEPLSDILKEDTQEYCNENAEYRCKFCKKLFFAKESLNVHELEHFKQNLQKRIRKRKKLSHTCEFCRDTFADLLMYKWHLAECFERCSNQEGINNNSKRKKHKY